MTASAQQPGSLGWLITNSVCRVPDVKCAILSADGLLLARSQGIPRDRAEQLTAVASGVVTLTQGIAMVYEAGNVYQTIVEMDRGHLFVMSIPGDSCLAVLAGPDCDIMSVVSEMMWLIGRIGQQITSADYLHAFRNDVK